MYNPKIHHRRSIRLDGYDYSQAGMYFVTLCTQGRECLFGRVDNGEMTVNEYGRIVSESWNWLVVQYDHVELDAWVVMPNHLHGIIVINHDCRGGSRTAPTNTGKSGPTIKQKPVGRLIGAFKTVSTKQINQIRNTPGMSVWQRNYWDHIIRDEKSLENIRNYILNNPARWAEDDNNPLNRLNHGKH